MKTATTMSAYGLARAVVFGGAWAAGAAAGPLGDGTAAPGGTGHAAMEGMDRDSGNADGILPGLAAADNGYRLELARTALAAGTPEPFAFRILGPGDVPVTGFDVEHEKRLHLIVVRRDGSVYRHLHPEMSPDGTWRTTPTLPAAGSYRVLADSQPEGGAKTTLGADIQVAGRYEPAPAQPSRVSTVDGYQVRLDGELTPGALSPVTATVTRSGQPVTDLQPYLGTYGHLVALRASDLGYLHVHPSGSPGDGKTMAGPGVRFAVEVPTAGRYRLFFDFQHNGQVRTAEFTVDTAGSPGGAR